MNPIFAVLWAISAGLIGVTIFTFLCIAAKVLERRYIKKDNWVLNE